MDAIKARINSTYYATPAAFQADFFQMFANAQTFNSEDSDVYLDADEMRKQCVAVLGLEIAAGGRGEVVVTDEDRISAAAFVEASEASALAAAGAKKIVKKRVSTTNPVPRKRKVLSDYESDSGDSDEEEDEDDKGDVPPRGRYDDLLPDIGY